MRFSPKRINWQEQTVRGGLILILSALLCSATLAVAFEHPGRHYDASGRYVGRKAPDGRHYDASGRYTGRIDSTGRRYDDSGRYLGREDKTGRRYDKSGRYTGRTEHSR